VGSFASVWPDHCDFRSTPVNGHLQAGRACPKGAMNGHGPYPITSSERASDGRLIAHLRVFFRAASGAEPIRVFDEFIEP
jgi:hypothetical protein